MTVQILNILILMDYAKIVITNVRPALQKPFVLHVLMNQTEGHHLIVHVMKDIMKQMLQFVLIVMENARHVQLMKHA